MSTALDTAVNIIFLSSGFHKDLWRGGSTLPAGERKCWLKRGALSCSPIPKRTPKNHLKKHGRDMCPPLCKKIRVELKHYFKLQGGRCGAYVRQVVRLLLASLQGLGSRQWQNQTTLAYESRACHWFPLHTRLTDLFPL